MNAACVLGFKGKIVKAGRAYIIIIHTKDADKDKIEALLNKEVIGVAVCR